MKNEWMDAGRPNVERCKNGESQHLDWSTPALIPSLSTIQNVPKMNAVSITRFYSSPPLPQIPHSAKYLTSADKAQQ
jgi:hypothetical protein